MVGGEVPVDFAWVGEDVDELLGMVVDGGESDVGRWGVGAE